MDALRLPGPPRHIFYLLLMAAGLSLAGPTFSADVPSPTPPGHDSAGFSYPLDGIVTETDLLGRLMSGGCWLAGLPGRPSYNGRNVHAGIDLRASLGDAIYAIAPGIVDPASDIIHSGYGPGWTPGYVVLVRCKLPDGTPYIAIYGHTQAHRVKGGDVVVAGQALAEVGPWLPDQGGPHLHLTIRMGELPRFGWGTPTLTGQTVREGAEVVSCPAEVEALGYRNPLEFLKGNAAPTEPAAGSEPAPILACGNDLAHFLAIVAEHWQGGGKPCPKPVADPFSRSSEPVRRGAGWLQTFGTKDSAAGALLLKDGDSRAHWVGEPLWTIFNLRGGISELGYPVGDAYNWPDTNAQSFEHALLVLETATGRVRVIDRAY